MAALPIRLRLTLAFAVAMAVVLAALGLFLVQRVGASSRSTVDDGLRGVLPVTLGTAAGGKGFTIQEIDENGKPVAVSYEVNRISPDKVVMRRLSPKIQIKKQPKSIKLK